MRLARAALGLSLSCMLTRLPHWAPPIDPSTLSRYEWGQYVPNASVLIALAVAYGVTAGDLLIALEDDLKYAV